jgi:hypothetical protein
LLTELKSAIQTLAPVEPDWDKLATEVSPEIFAARVKDWKATQDHITKIDAEQRRIADEQAADAAKGFSQYVADQQAKLEIELPEIKDPVKGVALKKDLATFAKTRGFTDADLASVTDHRLVLLLHDAMQHHQAKAKAPAIQNKIEHALADSPPEGKRTVNTRTKLDAAKQRLRQTGSVEDGAAAIEQLIGRT